MGALGTTLANNLATLNPLQDREGFLTIAIGVLGAVVTTGEHSDMVKVTALIVMGAVVCSFNLGRSMVKSASVAPPSAPTATATVSTGPTP